MSKERGLRSKLNIMDDACDFKQEIKEIIEYWSTSPSNRLQRYKELEKIIDKN